MAENSNTGSSSTENGKAERNRQLVVQGFRRFAAGDIEVLRALLREDFIEHSPGNPSGRDAFIEFIAGAPVAKAQLDLHRVIADDDHVVVHYRMNTPDERAVAVVDIWRLVDGQIVEHSDVLQPVPDAALTPHGMC